MSTLDTFGQLGSLALCLHIVTHLSHLVGFYFPRRSACGCEAYYFVHLSATRNIQSFSRDCVHDSYSFFFPLRSSPTLSAPVLPLCRPNLRGRVKGGGVSPHAPQLPWQCGFAPLAARSLLIIISLFSDFFLQMKTNNKLHVMHYSYMSLAEKICTCASDASRWLGSQFRVRLHTRQDISELVPSPSKKIYFQFNFQLLPIVHTHTSVFFLIE